MKNMSKHIEIVKLLIFQKATATLVIEQLELIAANPNIYIEESDRMLDYSDDYLWLAMVDLLIDNGYAFEIDWKESYAEAKDCLVRLFEKSKVVVTLDEPDDFNWDADAEEFFPEINKILAEQGVYRLYNLDINSDSYVTVLSTIEKQEQLHSFDERIKLY